MKKISQLFLFTLLFSFFACEVTDLDLRDDPNNVTPESLNANLLLNTVQVQFAAFFAEATEAGAEATRLEYMFNEYAINFNNTNPNNGNVWSIAYSDILADVKALEVIAERDNLPIHAGMAKTIKAYVLMTLVDYFNDVPYSEALRADEGIDFPSVDPGQDVYAAALEQLDAALADFANAADATANPERDFFYDEADDGDVATWIKLANSLKFKYYLNLRLTDQAGAKAGIDALLMEGNLITDNSESFVFTYDNSDNIFRHPYYIEEYAAAVPADYMSNYLMWAMADEKGLQDPRWRYYFYRQRNDFPTEIVDLNRDIDCWDNIRPAHFDAVDQNLPFCSLNLNSGGMGFWGRDHGSAEGIPPDTDQRTVFGVYPIGGRFDDNNATPIADFDGLNGNGIWPIMNASFVDFMRAEAALFLGTSDDAKTLTLSGVNKSIAQVMNFLPNPDAFTNIPEDDDITAYTEFVGMAYDEAGSDDEKMGVIGKEYHIALFGNGVEAYNLFRRTGKPSNLQPTLLNLGDFPRSFLYPSVSVDANTNISQKSGLSEPVFWDNNPASLTY